jgi:hypothetical protein
MSRAGRAERPGCSGQARGEKPKRHERKPAASRAPKRARAAAVSPSVGAATDAPGWLALPKTVWCTAGALALPRLLPMLGPFANGATLAAM